MRGNAESTLSFCVWDNHWQLVSGISSQREQETTGTLRWSTRSRTTDRAPTFTTPALVGPRREQCVNYSRCRSVTSIDDPTPSVVYVKQTDNAPVRQRHVKSIIPTNNRLHSPFSWTSGSVSFSSVSLTSDDIFHLDPRATCCVVCAATWRNMPQRAAKTELTGHLPSCTWSRYDTIR